jgi:Pvc16 N-terminal domain
VLDSGVIYDVSLTLRSFINEQAAAVFPGGGTADLNDLSDPTVKASSLPPLSIFLFEIMEDASARNEPRVRQTQNNTVVIKKPPMAIQLNYLFTPWTGNPQTDQQILGRLLQLFYEQAILSGPVLQGQLAGTTTALKVTLHTLTLEERTRIWLALTRPYRTSLSYGVRVVNIDVSQSTTTGTVMNGRLVSSTQPGGTP